MSWAVVVVGFLAVMTFVIAMGRLSTGRYEGELRSKKVLAHRPSRSAREASTHEGQKAPRHEVPVGERVLGPVVPAGQGSPAAALAESGFAHPRSHELLDQVSG